MDALRKCEADPLVICTVARLYWADRRIEKAREWFERAVKVRARTMVMGGVGGSNSERQHGTAAQQEGCYCAMSGGVKPRHGETWQPIAKDDKNGEKSVKEILELVAAALQ